MQTINLYKYTRPDGGTTVSPIKPDCDYTEMFRLVADEGMVLQNGDIQTVCTDVETVEGWIEVDAPEILYEETDIPISETEAVE
jgi:hypothetical protein